MSDFRTDTENAISAAIDEAGAGVPDEDANAAASDNDAGEEAAPAQDDSAQQQQDTGKGDKIDASDKQQQPAQPSADTANPDGSAQAADTGQHGAPRPDGLKSDKVGNLTDAYGKVAIPAGGPRRIYEGAVSHAVDANRRAEFMQRENVRLGTEVTQLRTYANEQKQLGLTNDQVRASMKMMHTFQTDPGTAIQNILTEAKAKGYDLSKILGDEFKSKLDMSAVNRMVEQRFGPVVEGVQQQESEQRVDAEATRAYEAFLSQHEYASVHENVMADMMSKDASLTPEVAYWKLHAFIARNGLDVSQPLAAQMQQSATPIPPTGVNQPARPVQEQQAPMAQGGGSSAQGVMADTVPLASADASWNDIVGDAMKEAGIN